MTTVRTALYDHYDDASRAVSDLEAAGIPHRDVSIVANNAHGGYAIDDDHGSAAGTGATIGTVVGGGAGLLAGLGVMAIPGIGPVVAAGWLAATALGAVAGAGVGAATGGVVGALTKEGLDEKEAHFYAEGVRRGGCLVTVRADDSQRPVVDEILNKRKPIDASTRAAAYRESGWQRFDENAPPYSAEEIERERRRYATTMPLASAPD